MGFGFDLITRVEDIEEQPDGWIVEIRVAEGALMPRKVQVSRARARAMVAVGLVEVTGERSRDIANAIKDLDFDEINRATTVIDGTAAGPVVTIKVNKE